MQTSLISIVMALAAFGSASPFQKRQAYSGFATFYFQNATGGNPGSCGDFHADSDLIVAISQDSPFTNNEFCGRSVSITNTGGGDQNNGVGTTITALVADTCPECDPSHLDLSTGSFQALTGGNLDPPGRINIDWHII